MTKKLTIKGITFPNFGDDDSKKNFRLVFYIGYTDANGDEAVEVVSKPETKHWQWRNQKKDAFLKPKIVGDSVELEVLTLRNGDGDKIAKGSHKIGEIDGEISDITVQFMDVHDSTIGDIFGKEILPQLIDVWKTVGLNPIDMAPIPGGVKILIKKKIDLEKMADDAKNHFQKKLKDKILHSISAAYDGKAKQLTLKEKDVVWDEDEKPGTYAVTIGIA